MLANHSPILKRGFIGFWATLMLTVTSSRAFASCWGKACDDDLRMGAFGAILTVVMLLVGLFLHLRDR